MYYKEYFIFKASNAEHGLCIKEVSFSDMLPAAAFLFYMR